MSTFWKKVLISLFGLVIISIFVGRVFEETVQEGVTPLPVTMANQAVIVAADATQIGLQSAEMVTDAVTFGAETSLATANAAQEAAQRATIATAATGQRGAIAATETAQNTTNFVADELTKNLHAGMDTAQKSSIFTLGQLKDTLRTLMWRTIMITILGVAILLGKYVFFVIGWFFNAIKCGFIYLSKFNSCALWYLLDIISWFIYWICYFIPWGFLDLFFMSWISEIDEDDDIKPWYFWRNVWKPLMDLLDEFDCAFYEIFGFYIIHFKENVKDKCFNCDMVKFPNTPDLSNREGIRDAYNEYGAGLIGGIFRA